jgi:hypothetical protein
MRYRRALSAREAVEEALRKEGGSVSVSSITPEPAEEYPAFILDINGRKRHFIARISTKRMPRRFRAMGKFSIWRVYEFISEKA